MLLRARKADMSLLRSGSHLGHFAAMPNQVAGLDRIQNVIQGVSRNTHFPEDLACAAM